MIWDFPSVNCQAKATSALLHGFDYSLVWLALQALAILHVVLLLGLSQSRLSTFHYHSEWNKSWEWSYRLKREHVGSMWTNFQLNHYLDIDFWGLHNTSCSGSRIARNRKQEIKKMMKSDSQIDDLLQKFVHSALVVTRSTFLNLLRRIRIPYRTNCLNFTCSLLEGVLFRKTLFWFVPISPHLATSPSHLEKFRNWKVLIGQDGLNHKCMNPSRKAIYWSR